MNTAQLSRPMAGSPSVVRVTGWQIGIGLVVAMVFFGLFMAVADFVVDGSKGEVRFDQSVLLWLHHHVHPGLTSVAHVLAWMGSPLVMILVSISAALIGLLVKRLRGAAWTFPIAIVGAGAIIQVTKLFVHRQRPDLFAPLLKESGYSFPSGHSLIAVVAYGLVGYFVYHLVQTRTARVAVIVVTVALIFLIGVSRLYVEVHYPTDVLAGWAAGVPWLITCLGLHEIMVRRWPRSGEAVLRKPPVFSSIVDTKTNSHVSSGQQILI
jgi:undecaprenyl-diphosphatase